MMVLSYSYSFKYLKEYVTSYNEDSEAMSLQIRNGVYATAQNLIKLYGLSLAKLSKRVQIDKTDLPSLRTNNVQLSQMVPMSPRTVQRHIKKLEEAGVITHKVWHGTNSSYEVWLNPKVLCISEGISSIVEDKKRKDTKKEVLKNSFKTTTVIDYSSKCLHTETRNLNNNIIIEVENPDYLERLKSVFVSSTAVKERREHSLTSIDLTGNTRNQESNVQFVVTYKNDSSSEVARNDCSLSDLTGNNEVARNFCSKKELYSGLFWDLARKILYKDRYLSEYQERTAKEHLREWYAPAGEKNVVRYHEIYIERLNLVRKYLDKDKLGRFVPLPDKYFDLKNKHGFTATKVWWQKQQLRNKEVHTRVVLQAQIRKYTNNLKKDTAKQRPILTVFRECEQRIGKLQVPQLLDEFYTTISQKQ